MGFIWFNRVEHGTHCAINIKKKKNTQNTQNYKNKRSKHADQAMTEEQGRKIRFILGNIKCPQCELGTGLIGYHQRKQKRGEEERELN